MCNVKQLDVVTTEEREFASRAWRTRRGREVGPANQLSVSKVTIRTSHQVVAPLGFFHTQQRSITVGTPLLVRLLEWVQDAAVKFKQEVHLILARLRLEQDALGFFLLLLDSHHPEPALLRCCRALTAKLALAVSHPGSIFRLISGSFHSTSSVPVFACTLMSSSTAGLLFLTHKDVQMLKESVELKFWNKSCEYQSVYEELQVFQAKQNKKTNREFKVCARVFCLVCIFYW